tara:strand:+ start:261 stop:695 length:435 start_codon:yes stop_codon:yes gene_type:complete
MRKTDEAASNFDEFTHRLECYVLIEDQIGSTVNKFLFAESRNLHLLAKGIHTCLLDGDIVDTIGDHYELKRESSDLSATEKLKSQEILTELLDRFLEDRFGLKMEVNPNLLAELLKGKLPTIVPVSAEQTNNKSVKTVYPETGS